MLYLQAPLALWLLPLAKAPQRLGHHLVRLRGGALAHEVQVAVDQEGVEQASQLRLMMWHK